MANERAAIPVVPMELKEFMELLLQRMAKEQLEPMRNEFHAFKVEMVQATGKLESEVALVRQAVMGNGAGIPLANQIQEVRVHAEATVTELRNDCNTCRERLHIRISEVKDKLESNPVQSQDHNFIQELRGAGKVIVACIGLSSAFTAGAIKLLEYLSHR